MRVPLKDFLVACGGKGTKSRRLRHLQTHHLVRCRFFPGWRTGRGLAGGGPQVASASQYGAGRYVVSTVPWASVRLDGDGRFGTRCGFMSRRPVRRFMAASVVERNGWG